MIRISIMLVALLTYAMHSWMFWESLGNLLYRSSSFHLVLAIVSLLILTTSRIDRVREAYYQSHNKKDQRKRVHQLHSA